MDTTCPGMQMHNVACSIQELHSTAAHQIAEARAEEQVLVCAWQCVWDHAMEQGSHVCRNEEVPESLLLSFALQLLDQRRHLPPAV